MPSVVCQRMHLLVVRLLLGQLLSEMKESNTSAAENSVRLQAAQSASHSLENTMREMQQQMKRI